MLCALDYSSDIGKMITSYFENIIKTLRKLDGSTKISPLFLLARMTFKLLVDISRAYHFVNEDNAGKNVRPAFQPRCQVAANRIRPPSRRELYNISVI